MKPIVGIAVGTIAGVVLLPAFIFLPVYSVMDNLLSAQSYASMAMTVTGVVAALVLGYLGIRLIRRDAPFGGGVIAGLGGGLLLATALFALGGG